MSMNYFRKHLKSKRNFVIILLALAVCFFGYKTSEFYRALQKFQKVLYLVTTNYVIDIKDPNKLIDAAINGLLGKLDPHSAFLDKSVFKDCLLYTSPSPRD